MRPWGDPFWLVVGGYLLSAILTASIGYAIYQRRGAGAKWFAAGMFALAGWSLGAVARLFSPTEGVYLLTTGLTYVAITVTPVALLTFALIYAGQRHVVTREGIALLFVIPVFTVVSLSTDPIHGLFFGSFRRTVLGSHAVFKPHEGPLFWVHVAYTYLLFGAATYLLLGGAFRRFTRYRVQSASLAVGALIPWVVNVVYLFLDATFPIDPTPLAFAVGVPFLAFGVFRAGLIDLTPVARSVAFDAIAAAVIVVGREGRVIDANETGRALLGVTDPVGTPIETLLPAPLMAEGPAPRAVDIDGEHRWYRRQAVALPEEPDVEVLLFSDVTDLVRTERHLREQNRRLEGFAEVAAHDLRNPLSIIDGMTDLTRETGDLSYLDRVGPAVARMETLVDDLLALGRQGRVIADPEPSPLRPLVEGGWDRAVHSETATLVLNVGDTLAVRADSDRLRTLFENLFSNAVRHAGPDVTVEVGVLPDGFYVADDGPGVPSAARNSAFEYGYSTHRDGTGLGLPLVNCIASAHRWDVSLTESEDGGTRVEVHGVEFTRAVAGARP